MQKQATQANQLIGGVLPHAVRHRWWKLKAEAGWRFSLIKKEKKFFSHWL